MKCFITIKFFKTYECVNLQKFGYLLDVTTEQYLVVPVLVTENPRKLQNPPSWAFKMG